MGTIDESPSDNSFRIYTEMLSTTTLADLSGVDRKTINHRIKKRNIETFSDVMDKRKMLILSRMENLTRLKIVSKSDYPHKVEAFLQCNCFITEMISIDTAQALLGLGILGGRTRKTVKFWINKLKIKTFQDSIDRRKKLITFKDLIRIGSMINPRMNRAMYASYENGKSKLVPAWHNPIQLKRRYKSKH